MLRFLLYFDIVEICSNFLNTIQKDDFFTGRQAKTELAAPKKFMSTFKF